MSYPQHKIGPLHWTESSKRKQQKNKWNIPNSKMDFWTGLMLQQTTSYGVDGFWNFWIFGFFVWFFFGQCPIGYSKYCFHRRGRPAILRHVAVKRWCHMRRQQIDPQLIEFSPHKWTTGSGAHFTPITRSARLWPHSFRTQPPYKEIWFLKKHRNTKVQATKLHPRSPTLGTVGLPNGPTTPQLEVECCSQKPWENGSGKGSEGRKDAVMDFSRGVPWKGPGSIERPCTKLTSLRTMITPTMHGREVTTYINYLSLEFRETKFMRGTPK